MGHIVADHWLKADLPTVFAFFSDPANLPRLMPRQMDVRLESLHLQPPSDAAIHAVVQSGALPGNLAESGEIPSKLAGPGSLIDTSFRLVPFLPMRARWVAEILEYEPLSYFLDQQKSGPMRSWIHRHSFREETRQGITGTVIRDEVAYELPFGPLGIIADALLVERMMQRTFATRQQQLEQIFLQ
jgi:ligand-binding SRPBCC domain-containing protein